MICITNQPVISFREIIHESINPISMIRHEIPAGIREKSQEGC